MKIYQKIGFFACFLFYTLGSFSQEEESIFVDNAQNDSETVSDAFQESFFEALKQKGIENHEKAIEVLFKCLEIDPKPVVYFELGKNYNALERYSEAARYLEEARRKVPQNEAVLRELYHTYFSNRQFQEVLPVLQDLSKINSNFSEDLANVYFLNQHYESALQLLDQLAKEGGGNSDFRESLRLQIYANTNNDDARIADLKEKINKNPQEEQNYLNLIFVYSEGGRTQEAFELAKKLAQENPTSELVQLALYKFYLEENSLKKAIASMKIVLESDEIDQDTKYKVLNDFLLLAAEDVTFEEELLEAVQIFAKEAENAVVYEKIGDFLLKKQQNQQALNYYELGLGATRNDFQLTMKILPLLFEFSAYQRAADLSENAMQNFPSQPILYYQNARALNLLGRYKEAEDILTFGLDFVIEDPEMEVNFYEEMAKAFSGMKNEQKASEFRQKALKLKN